jgi:signal transduction histidine kinase
VFEALVADRGVVLLRNAVDAGLEVSAVKYRDKPITPQKVSVSRTILDKVLSEKVAVLSKDAQNDDRFGASESIIMSQTRSTICVPMLMSGAVMGAMHLDTSSAQRSFSDDDLEFAMIIATEAAVAIDNMRMRSAAIHRERLAAVGETVAGISHNVKNILLLSQGGAELLSRAIDKGDVQGARDSWAVVKRGIDKIGALVRDMLEYSSNKKPDLRPANINDMVCAIAQEVEPQLIKKNVMLELDVDESIGERVVDDLGLQRTIYNLIVNAMEAIQHNEGQITIATSQRPDGTLVITIRDNGSGIPADKLEKIWYPFFTTKGSTGTGLGLPMCKKCVEDMNGRIYCESEENLGTLFTIEIPKIVPA